MIQCIVIGKPQPSVTWCIDGIAVDVSNPNYVLTEQNNATAVDSTITINSVVKSDYGNWSCKAENTIAGNLKSSDMKMTLLTIACE